MGQVRSREAPDGVGTTLWRDSAERWCRVLRLTLALRALMPSLSSDEGT